MQIVSSLMRCVGFVASMSLCSACSTIANGTTQGITVTTNPSGASCVLDRAGERIGAIPLTPGTVTISKSGTMINVSCTKKGYITGTAEHRSEFAAATVGNLLLGGVVGIVVDAASGASNIYPPEVRIPLLPEESLTVANLNREANPGGRQFSPGVIGTPPASEPTNSETEPPANDQQYLGLHCPETGTRVVRSDGTRVIYQGVDKGNPDICLMTISGRPVRYYFGLWPVGDRPQYEAYSSLLKLQQKQSDTVTFTTTNEINVYEEKWTIKKGDDFVSEAGEMKVIRLEHEHSGLYNSSFQSRNTYIVDRKTGVLVAYEPKLIRGGYFYDRPWSVVEISNGVAKPSPSF